MAAPPPPPPPPDPMVLIDDLVEEFLLRLPPEDPALLARAALVSRQWYRIVTGPSFRRRFREFHRSTPLLGYVLNLADSIRFVSLSSFRPPHAHRGGVRAVSSSHGRVLLQHRSAGGDLDVFLSVWDPITDEQQDLPVVPLRPTRYLNIFNWDAAVIYAVGDGCNHLHCHFKVVFVGQRKEKTFSCFYSSEADSWSDPVFASEGIIGAFIPGNCVLIESTLYGKSAASYDIFKYDMLPNQMCNIRIILGPGVRLDDCMLIATEDGRLGVAKASNSTLVVWVREHGRWEESRTIDLQALLPLDALPDPLLPYEVRPWLTGFAETGAAVIFLWTRVGYFTIDLKSGSLGLRCSLRQLLHSRSPAPGAVSTDDRPETGVAISTYEVPVAVIAVSTDEGPGAGVAASANEGPGAAGLCQMPKKLKLQVQGPLSQERN